jgi:hypothetical protein
MRAAGGGLTAPAAPARCDVPSSEDLIASIDDEPELDGELDPDRDLPALRVVTSAAEVAALLAPAGAPIDPAASRARRRRRRMRR